MNQTVNEDMIRDAATVKPESQDYTLTELMSEFDNAIGSRRYNEDEIFVKFAGEFIDEDLIPNVLFERIIIDGVPRNTLVIAPAESAAAREKLKGVMEDLKRSLVKNSIDTVVAVVTAEAKAAALAEELAEAKEEIEDLKHAAKEDAQEIVDQEKEIVDQEMKIADQEMKIAALKKKLAKLSEKSKPTAKPAAKKAKPKR
jgi:hypothetical protein